MNKELYLQYRKNYFTTGEIHRSLPYEYYKDHNQVEKYDVNPDDFYRLFQEYIATLPIKMGVVNSIMKRIIEYLDKKFEIVVLKDKENKILDVY